MKNIPKCAILNSERGGEVETTLYEFSFDYVKAIGFFIILVVGVAFFFADKIVGKNPTNSYVDPKMKEISPKVFKIILRSIGVFCFVIFLISFGGHIYEYNAYKTMLKTDNVSVVEGYVENYNPLPADGKGTENFEINEVYFSYNDATATNGYNTTARSGGVITGNGQHLIIKYVTNEDGENIILYIAEIE